MTHIQRYFSPTISVPALISGILLYHTPHYCILAIVALAISVITARHISQNNTCSRIFFILFLWGTLGYYAAHYELQEFNVFHHTINQKIVTLNGIITDYQYCAHVRNKHRLTLTLVEYICADKRIPSIASCFIYLNHPSPMQPYALGTYICIQNICIQKPEPEFARYLLKEGVIASAFVSQEKVKKLYQTTPWYKRVYEVRATLFATIKQQLSRQQFALFSSLFLGNKLYNKKDTEPIQDQFRIWGVAHIFARSGMHISIIVSIILYVLWFIPLAHVLKIIMLIIIGIVYTLCSWSSVSFLRSLGMFLLAHYAAASKRYVSPLYLLTLITTAMLIWHPIYLFFLDFQLSFGLTASLIWICTYISSRSNH